MNICSRCWINNNNLPTEITCLSPAHPPSGFLNPALTTYAYGQQVTFQCNDGFQLVGEETAACISENMWSNSSPDCEGKITWNNNISNNVFQNQYLCPNMAQKLAPTLKKQVERADIWSKTLLARINAFIPGNSKPE